MSTWQRHLMERPEPPPVDRDEPNEIEWAMINEICAYMHMCTHAHLRNVRTYSRAPVHMCVDTHVHTRTFR